MKIVIDDKICLKNKLPLQEVLMAIVIRSSDNPQAIIDNMIGKQVLASHEGKLTIAQHWDKVIDTILVDSAGAREDEER